MATRSQVLSMFGATPEQVRQAELQRQQDFLRSASGDPYQMAGGALGLGLARLFGGKSEQLTQAEQLQERFKGIDVNNPEALREAARGIADLAPEQALQIASYANELEKTMQPKVEYRDVTVAYTQRPVINRLTGLPTGEFEEVPVKDTAIIQNGVITGYTSGRGIGGAEANRVPMTSEEAAAIVNAETANMDYRQTDRDASGTIIGVTPQQEVAQPTLQMTTEMTGPAISPTPVIQGTSASLVDRFKTELSDVNRQLSLGRKTLSAEDKKFYIERRKELLQKIAQQEGRSSTNRTRSK